eukprot:9347257-Pyramimonas_sp.AAC.1
MGMLRLGTVFHTGEMGHKLYIVLSGQVGIPPVCLSYYIFSRRTNQTQEEWVYSHDGPIRRGRPKSAKDEN